MPVELFSNWSWSCFCQCLVGGLVFDHGLVVGGGFHFFMTNKGHNFQLSVNLSKPISHSPQYTHFNMKLGKVPFMAVITAALLGPCSALDEIGSKVDVGGDIFDSDASLKVLRVELSSNLSVP